MPLIPHHLLEPITVLRKTIVVDVDRDEEKTVYTASETLSAAVTNNTTNDVWDVRSNVLERTLRVRIFGAADIDYRDRIFYRGETWLIEGEPRTQRDPRNPRWFSTSFIITKEGLGDEN